MFDVNDFDETLPGPFEWDVKRMAASFEIAARNNGFSTADTRAATLASVRAYREAMADFAQMPTMDIWHAHLDEDELGRGPRRGGRDGEAGEGGEEGREGGQAGQGAQEGRQTGGEAGKGGQGPGEGGDAVETPNFFTGEPVLSMLAGPANREGRIAADTIAGREDVGGYRGTQGTAVVKVFDMTAGGTGLTETELRAAGMDYRKVDTHQMGHAGYYPGTAPLFLKMLFDPADGKLLGAQVLGWDGVDKRIDVLAVAIRAGMTVFDLEHLELAYAPPYGAAKDPVNMAGFLGANLLRGDIDLWYPEDYPDCRDQVTILDVRTPAEYDTWHIPGAVLIPFTELRQRLDEVPRDKPVYTYCRSGLRSYIAYCVLKQNGWDQAAFLSGGVMTYHGYHRTPLKVGKGGMPMVAHAEDELAQRPGALEHV
jgi:rhodanese-related sulfurtransferase